MTDKTDTHASAVDNVATGETTAPGASSDPRYPNMRATVSVPTKQTWRDWLPEGEDEPTDDELITRAELLAQLRDADVDIAERTLQTWEAQGIMPGPIRRWHQGATRALYAPWVVSLGRYADHLRAYAEEEPDLHSRFVRNMVKIAIRKEEVWKGAMADGRLADALQDLAQRFEANSGEHPDMIKLQICRADGEHWQVYTFKLPTKEDHLHADT